MNAPVVFMFSGQGSQYYQMGSELYHHYGRFRYWMDCCDEIVRPQIGVSIVDVLYNRETKAAVFDRALYTNPALLCVEYSLCRVVVEMGIKPARLLGYSLGEYIAAVVAGALSLEKGLGLLIDYARVLEENPSTFGCMLSVLESPAIMEEHGELFTGCRLTAVNFGNNFVTAGKTADIQSLQQGLDEKEIVSVRLPVRHAFHTTFMDCVKDQFFSLGDSTPAVEPGIPIISSFSMAKVDSMDMDYLWNVVRYPVHFKKTAESLIESDDYVFIDMGPSGTLATFVKYLLPRVSGSLSLQTINAFGSDLKSLNSVRMYYESGVA